MKNLNVNVPLWRGFRSGAIVNYGASIVIWGALALLGLNFTKELSEPNFNLTTQFIVVIVATILALFIKREHAKWSLRNDHAKEFVWFKFSTELILMLLLAFGAVLFNTEGFGHLKGFI